MNRPARAAGAAFWAVLVIVAVSTSGAVPAAARARDASQPNVLLILTDDQRFDSLWAMPEVTSKLVDRGVTFRNAFVVNPLCCPSRTSILTGLYSHGTGVYSNEPPHGGVESFDPSSTIATWLQSAGYDTALIGKYLNGYRGTVIPPGWSVFDALNSDEDGGLYYNYTMNMNGSQVSFGDSRSDYSTNVVGRLASRFIAQATGPFFLEVTPRAPHRPSRPARPDRDAFSHLPPWRPPSYNEADVSDKPPWLRKRPRMSRRRQHKLDGLVQRQYETLLSVDRMVGALIDQLKSEGKLSNTLIIFSSDNGLLWGEHRLEGKVVPYEESIRVPLLMRWDERSRQAITQPDFALNIDFAPTIAAAAGVTPASPVDGKSLLPFFGRPPALWRDAFLVEHYGVGPPTYCAVRSRGFLFVAYGTGPQELYRLTSDPWQLENVADDPKYSSVQASMLETLRTLCDPPPPDYVVP